MRNYIRDIIREKDKEYFDHMKAITSERGEPAAGERPNVEQQAEEELVQLSKPVEGEPEV